jgi:hypothetical protein
MEMLVKRSSRVGVLAVLAVALLGVAPSRAGAATVGPTAAFEFPSSDSTVVASTGFIDDDEVGYFWSAARGDRVTENFSGPASVDGAVLKATVITNALNSGAEVDWRIEINGVVVGRFRVREGFTGTFTVSRAFAPIPGPMYHVTIRVTNEVAGGEGSHTLAYAGASTHVIKLHAA